MEDCLDEIIDKKLQEFNLLPLKQQKENIQKHLRKIEEVIQGFSEARKACIKEYKSSRMNVLAVVKEAQIARQTVYNNKEILEAYILKSHERQEQEDLFSKLDFFQEKIYDLERQIYLMQLRDITIEKLEFENETLEDTIKENLKAIEGLEIRNKELIEENNKIKKVFNSYQINVIKFNDDKK